MWQAKDDYIRRNTFKYVVNSADADANQVISIKFNKRGETKIQFDESKIECRKQGSNALLPTGTIVEIGGNYNLKAKLGAGEAVENWYANNKYQNGSSRQNEFTYSAREDHINSENVIEIKFSLIGDLKIKFDASKIKCEKVSDHSSVSTGDFVMAGQNYKFSPKDPNKEVRDWYVGGDEQDKHTNEFTYMVESVHADINNIIEVSFAEKVLIKIQFDASKMTCNKDGNGNVNVATGDVVHAGTDHLRFTATPTAGKIVERWYVNGAAQANSDKKIFSNIQ